MARIETLMEPKRTEQDINLANLQKFCGSHRSMDKPYTLGKGWVYATNAVILVRMPENMLPADLPAPVGKPPDAEAVFNDAILAEADFSVAPELDLTNQFSCTLCRGTGHTDDPNCFTTCPDCDDGVVECRLCGSNMQCDECHGRGLVYESIPCLLCTGGRYTHILRVGGRLYDPFYPYLVQNTFGRVEWGRHGEEILVFKMDSGVSGCLMSLNEKR